MLPFSSRPRWMLLTYGIVCDSTGSPDLDVIRIRTLAASMRLMAAAMKSFVLGSLHCTSSTKSTTGACCDSRTNLSTRPSMIILRASAALISPLGASSPAGNASKRANIGSNRAPSDPHAPSSVASLLSRMLAGSS